MFDHIIASLAPEFSTEVQDLILIPPRDNLYAMLKEQLVKQTAASEHKGCSNFLMQRNQEIGNHLDCFAICSNS